jgi:hypothetical protein
MIGPLRGDAASIHVNGSSTHIRDVDGNDVSTLITILGRIIAACDKELHPAFDQERVERWEDEHYVYFGACLPDTGRDIDINVHDSGFMVRLAKMVEESDLD